VLLPVEQITEQLQQERQDRLRRLGTSEAASSEFPSGPPSVTDDASMHSSSYVHASQMAGSSIDGAASRPKRSKAQLWQEMKINSITRALSLIYTISLLTMLTRIQLNLLGRRTYLSSVVALASPPPAVEDSKISLENRDDDNYDNMYGNDFETNRKYLTFSWWLLHRGSKHIMDRVMGATKEVFGQVNIREDMSLERLSDLVMQVRKKVEGSTEQERRDMKWLEYLLPPKEDESFVIRQSNMSESEESLSPEARVVEDPMTASSVEAEEVTDSLRRLLDETSDLIDSPTFIHVLTRLLDTSFSHLVDYHIASEAFKTPATPIPGTATSDYLPSPRITEIPDVKCKLAHILPIFCKQAHAIAAGSGELDALAGAAAQQGLGNEYLAAIDQVHDLSAFAAVIYSSNFEYEVAESPSSTAPQSERAQSQPKLDILDPVPESTDQVETSFVDETEPVTVAESSVGEGGVALPSSAAAESAHTGAEQQSFTGFEAAWERARYDGVSEKDGG
jgi:peroxin-3